MKLSFTPLSNKYIPTVPITKRIIKSKANFRYIYFLNFYNWMIGISTILSNKKNNGFNKLRYTIIVFQKLKFKNQ